MALRESVNWTLVSELLSGLPCRLYREQARIARMPVALGQGHGVGGGGSYCSREPCEGWALMQQLLAGKTRFKEFKGERWRREVGRWFRSVTAMSDWNETGLSVR